MARWNVTIPILVEGKYDKARLSGVVSGTILVLNGFGIFNDEEKKTLLRRLGAGGLILLCDSDGGGRQIRSGLKEMLAGIPLYDLYIPEIPGKEPRKRKRGAAGLLGVEGVDNETLEALFERFSRIHPEFFGEDCRDTPDYPVTRALLFELGLSGGKDAVTRRDAVAAKLGLPGGMTANAFFAAVSLLTDEPGLSALAGETEVPG